MSKKAINQGTDEEGAEEHMSKAFFGSLDSSLFLSYSICQFFGSNVGDKYNKRIVLSISYVIQAFVFICLGIAGSHEFYNKIFY